MIARNAALAALAALASGVAACSPSDTAGPQASSSPVAVAIAAPSPAFDYSPKQRQSCSVPGPRFQFVNPNSGNAFPVRMNAYLRSQAQSVLFSGQIAVPAIGIVRQFASNDVAQLTILPDGSDADALLAHVAYTDALAQQQLGAANGTPAPSPDPSAVAADAAFVDTVEPRIRDEELGGNFSDYVFAGDQGDPNHWDPHRFALICRYLPWLTPSGQRQKYTVILSLIHSARNTADQTFAQTKTLLNGSSVDSGNVGWHPVGRYTYFVRSVTPALIPAYLADDDNQLGKMAHISWPAVTFDTTVYVQPLQTPGPAPSTSFAPPAVAKS